MSEHLTSAQFRDKIGLSYLWDRPQIAPPTTLAVDLPAAVYLVVSGRVVQYLYSRQTVGLHEIAEAVRVNVSLLVGVVEKMATQGIVEILSRNRVCNYQIQLTEAARALLAGSVSLEM